MTTRKRWILRAAILSLLAIALLPIPIPNLQIGGTLKIGPRQPPLTRHIEVARDSIITTVKFGVDSVGKFTTRTAVALEPTPQRDDGVEPTPETREP